MLRDVDRENNTKRIEPLLSEFFQQCGGDLEVFAESIEAMARKAGCSKALIASLNQGFHGVKCDFMNSVDEPLDPNYQYSKIILDDRIMFGKRS